MNNIFQIYEILSAWHKRFPGVDCVSVFFFEDSMRIRVDWLGKNHPSYTQSFDIVQLKNLKDFSDMDEFILNKIESAYKIWEVGEE
jgi:hypothetical protein